MFTHRNTYHGRQKLDNNYSSICRSKSSEQTFKIIQKRATENKSPKFNESKAANDKIWMQNRSDQKTSKRKTMHHLLHSPLLKWKYRGRRQNGTGRKNSEKAVICQKGKAKELTKSFCLLGRSKKKKNKQKHRNTVLEFRHFLEKKT